MIGPLVLCEKGLRRLGAALMNLAKHFPQQSTIQIIEQDGTWVVCRVQDCEWRLDSSKWLDRQIVERGIFEEDSVQWVKRLIKPGMVVLDVGANFGYYTILLSKLVGELGQVHAFEPTKVFRTRLADHIKRNQCKNVSVVDFGLSDQSSRATILCGEDSATMHWVDDGKQAQSTEEIRLEKLDEYVAAQKFASVDFIKVDIDGHECRFLSGAAQTIERFRPVMLMEFAELNLIMSGSDVEDLGAQLKKWHYALYSEKGGKPLLSRYEFLSATKNCAFSTNLICCPEELGTLQQLSASGADFRNERPQTGKKAGAFA
jgi:FkbM family methyltransferase